ncbi:MAG: hypothetical protein JWN86_1486 [Planctomycetota bacterium]|nr:hypothetical protein [Planctomycetota bacterium]
MRRTLIGLAAVLGLGTFATTSHAQDGFSDPFFLYYSFYLPRQAALAAQPTPEDFIRYNNTQRQVEVQSERRGLYEPISTIGLDELDPSRPYGARSGSSRLVRTSATGLVSSNLMGRGPASHYNRTAAYYPTMRTGVGRGGGRRAGGAASFGGGGGGGMARVPTASGGIPRGR